MANAETFSIVTFGDSTTAARENVFVYTDQLSKRLSGVGMNFRFLNKGVPGNDTSAAKLRFKSDVLDAHPDLVIIQFGINDSAVDVWRVPPKTTPRVPLGIFKENLRYFVTHIKQAGGDVILMTPNPIRWTDKLRSMYGKPPYKPDQEDGFTIILAEYAKAIRELASEYNVPLVDVYGMYDAWEKEHVQPCSELLIDGMHPKTEGHTLVAEALLPLIMTWAERKNVSK